MTKQSNWFTLNISILIGLLFVASVAENTPLGDEKKSGNIENSIKIISEIDNNKNNSAATSRSSYYESLTASNEYPNDSDNKDELVAEASSNSTGMQVYYNNSSSTSQTDRSLLYKDSFQNTFDNDHKQLDDDSVIKVGYLTNIHGRHNQQRQGIVISGAITLAISKVNNDTSKLNGKRIELIANDTEGITLLGTSAILDQWRRGAVAFFGPEDSCETEATIASAINLPMISYKCADSKASNKHFYRTFVRTHPPDTQIVSSVLALLSYFKWRKFSIISEKSTQFQTVARNLADRARASNFTINSESKFENIYSCCVDHKPCCHDALYNIIEDTFKRTRIYVFLGTVNDLISMMQVMQVKNLINSGDYLVIYVDLDQYNKSHAYKYFLRLDMDSGTRKTMVEAARSLLVVVTSPPNTSTYSDFEENVRRHNAMAPFNFTQPFPSFKKHITVYASYLYDAFMLYADALEETIKAGADIHDGAAIVKRIIGRKSYQSVTGPWMNIDSNGDVEGNYSVLALRPTPPDVKLKIFDDYYHTMLPVCNFYYENNTLSLTGTIDWVKGGRPPLDEPVCAYDGSICRLQPDFFREKLAAIQFVVLLTLSVFAIQIYRNWIREQEIAGLLWKMDMDDLQFQGNQLNRTQSRSSFASQMSNDSAGMRTRNTYTKTALYKGVIVGIKELKLGSKKDKDIPRATKIEMKQMKELRHDNINQFIGACVMQESNIIYIVTDYCSKGSLQDILDNQDVKLDSMFVSSLVFDLLSGLNYLHHSEFKFHGNLKSSNCLITSRWVLKLTDFGLHNFRMKTDAAPFKENMRHTHYRNQLWRAPELLRDPAMIGNQKTDVYAFGIILHEIIARHGPFGIDQSSMKPEDMVDSIRNPKACHSDKLMIDHSFQHNRLNSQRAQSGGVASGGDKRHPRRIDSLNCMTRHDSQCGSNTIQMQQRASGPHGKPDGRYIQLEMLKNTTVYTKACSIEAPAFTSIDMNDNSKLRHDNEDLISQDTPFLSRSDSKATANQQNNANNGFTSGKQADTLILFRPNINLVQYPSYVTDVMKECWSENPDLRPDINTIRRKLERMREGNKHNIIDNMMEMMARYANNLEEIVLERTSQLSEEKKKTELLLHRILPPYVASQLLVGAVVVPENFDAVTIFFSDIVGYTEMCSKSTAEQVCEFLNDVYTLFDGIISEYNVYKVETIGDAYMVVSGLPERIPNHADEIASMAIELLNSVKDFKIKHLPNDKLQLRMGIHTGTVAAGVAGTTMPRYCLFGDTVNVANRMEQYGQPLKIHASAQAKQHLDKSGNYLLESRGQIPIKGKGHLETYWLLGHKDQKTQNRHDPNSRMANDVSLFEAFGQLDVRKKNTRLVNMS